MMRAVNEIVASTAAAEREAERLRDELAALEEEQATLEAELAVFEADYLREVVTVLAELTRSRRGSPRPSPSAPGRRACHRCGRSPWDSGAAGP